MKVLSVTVPEALDHRITATVKRRRMQKSRLVREALERYLDETHEVRTGSFLDLAGDLIGCVKNAPADLSSNPKDLDGYGR